jgi:hypothetical protein
MRFSTAGGDDYSAGDSLPDSSASRTFFVFKPQAETAGFRLNAGNFCFDNSIAQFPPFNCVPAKFLK